MESDSDQIARSVAGAADGNGEGELGSAPAPPSSSDGVTTHGAHSSTTRYEQQIDLDSDSTHARVVQLVGSGRRVLELGPATGHMSRVLRDRDCSVVGIEVDPEMATEAGKVCERVIVGDLDSLDLDAELGSDRFDVIVAADVLEHLKDPLSALQRLRGFLAEGGFFVISLPNIAHGSVRLALLEGRFPYQGVGLLDETHLRFFTRENIDKLLDEAELAVAEVYRQELNIDASEVPFDRGAVPGDMLWTLEQDPEARTYQFIIKAIPLEASGLREIQLRIRELAHENARLQLATRQWLGRREAQLRTALVDVHDQLLRRDEDLHDLQEELDRTRRTSDALEEQVRRLRVRLDRILHSPPMRVYDKLRELPGVKGVVARRTAEYHAAVKSAGESGSD
jgi:2-polyprenyl-3-methyl-5-hydroxy-6-metoxy-1,4-benzoquinol methylase